MTPVLVLSYLCPYCKAFASSFDISKYNVVIIERAIIRDVRELLGILGVSSFPAIIDDSQVYQGQSAFDKVAGHNAICDIPLVGGSSLLDIALLEATRMS